MNDKELLEMAAKAAGYALADKVDSQIPSGGVWIIDKNGKDAVWSPLLDDGDALRLAVKLFFRVYVEVVGRDAVTIVCSDGELTAEAHGKDRLAATRRAIVRAAAEIGKANHK